MLEDIKSALQQPEWVTQAREETKRLRVHIHGTQKQTADYLNLIERYETASQLLARRKHCTPNKAIMSELLKPINKVFDAKGGAKHYNVTGNKKITDKLTSELSNIQGGRSVTDWLQQIWIDKFMTDPAGVIFMEWMKQDGIEKIYPTFKSIDCIRNYKRDGRQIKWIVFEPIKDNDRLYARVVDEVLDRYYDVTNPEQPTLVEAEPGTKYAEYLIPVNIVPALVNGEIESGDLTRMVSILDSVVDIADHYLRTTSVKNIHEFQHGMPIYWEYQSDCPKCGGLGMINGNVCDACDGSGTHKRKDVTDKKVLRYPQDDQQKITPDVAGFVEPAHQTWEQLRTEQKNLVIQMHDTLWGTHRQEASNETATGKFIDQQPVNDMLSNISSTVEATESWITDITGQFHLNNLYKGCSISYGRRYLIESSTAVWDDYMKARQTGAPESVLDYKLQQYWQSELRDDAIGMAYQLVLMQTEPFVHMTVTEVLKEQSIPAIDKSRKLYFSDWTDTIERDQLVTMGAVKARIELDKYIAGRIVPAETKQTQTKQEEQEDEL